MADVKHIEALTKTETKTVEVAPERFQLTLTRLEAEALKALLGGITGNYKGPLRSQHDPIWQALGKSGVGTNYTLKGDIVRNAVTQSPGNSVSIW